MNKVRFIVYLISLFGWAMLGTGIIYAQEMNSNTIQSYHENPWYWQYNGEPILLIGASDSYNLQLWAFSIV